jgi:hypothetical protein
MNEQAGLECLVRGLGRPRAIVGLG